jgi:hypothetical protein
MCWNETWNKVRIDQHMIIFLFKITRNKEMIYRHCFSTLH